MKNGNGVASFHVCSNALPERLQTVWPEESYFYAVHSGAELDLFMVAGGRRIGVEFKREDAPRLTHSMHVALKDLKLERLSVIYPGTRRYRLHDRVEALPLRDATDADRITGA